MDKNAYLIKENIHIVKGSEKIQAHIDGWNKHVNMDIYRMYENLFSGKLCDIGCNCALQMVNIIKFPKVLEIIGFDVFEKVAEYGQIVIDESKSKDSLSIIIKDFVNDDFNGYDNYFDGCYSFHTLEHIYKEDLDRFVKNISLIVKPSGPVLISIPYEKSYNSPEHMSFFNEGTLTDLFHRNGFKVKECFRYQEKAQDVLNGIFVNKGG